MSIFEVVPYIVVPFICMVIVVFINIYYNRFVLQRKGDSKSKIKAAARRPHQIEDHNRRLMKDSEKFSIWRCEKADEGILRTLQTMMECRKKDGK